MGCGTSSDVVQNAAEQSMEKWGNASRKSSKANNVSKNDIQSIAFVIPINNEGKSVKKLPPPRFQRLEEQQQSSQPEVTLEKLQKRQAEADERRRQILDLRIKSARLFHSKPQISVQR